MAVDEYESAVRQLPGQQRVGIADFSKQAAQCVYLCLGMPTPVLGIGQQLLGRDPAQLSDSVPNLDAINCADACRYRGDLTTTSASF
jgi:hypothetical protein